MKRVIRSSFGLRDEDWIYPDDEIPEVGYEDELWVYIERQPIHVTSDGTVSEEDMEWILTRSVKEMYLYDESWQFLVVSEYEANDLISDSINDYVKANALPNSDYVISGKIVIQYSYAVFEPKVSGYGEQADDEAAELREYDPDTIQVDKVINDNLVLERL